MKLPFRKVFDRWLDKRLKPLSKIELDRNNIFIFPSSYGFLLGLITFIVLVAATNYQNNLGYVAGFCILAVGLLSIIYTFRNLVNLRLEASAAKSVVVGDSAKFQIRLGSSMHKPFSALAIGTNSGTMQWTDVPSDGESTVEVTIPAVKRGWLSLDKVVCQTHFPFGFLRAWSWVKFDVRCLVYPRPIEPVGLRPASESDAQEGDQLMVGSEDFYGLKSYQVGDNKAHIDWKAYARARGLFSKSFVDSVSKSQTFRWTDVAHHERELAISYLAYWIMDAADKGEQYGLELPNEYIGVSQGDHHYHRCLQALALF